MAEWAQIVPKCSGKPSQKSGDFCKSEEWDVQQAHIAMIGQVSIYFCLYSVYSVNYVTGWLTKWQKKKIFLIV